MSKYFAIVRAQLNKVSRLFRRVTGGAPQSQVTSVECVPPHAPRTALQNATQEHTPTVVRPAEPTPQSREPASEPQLARTSIRAMPLPAPLTPPEANLTKYHFLPLEGIIFTKLEDWIRCKQDHRLAFPTISLMLASWHATPAGSLENKEIILRDAAGCDAGQWAQVKDQVMAGWILCSDGRFYHPYVAGKVLTAWNAKLDRAYQTECKRIAKWNERHEVIKERVPTYEEWIAAGSPSGRRSGRTKMS